MDILNYIESFTNNRDLMELFALNNYEPIGWFGLKNIKSKKISLLDMTKIDELYELGYEQTKKQMH